MTIEELEDENRYLKRIIASRISGCYMDDGEASFGGIVNGPRPFDFLRSSAMAIEKFLYEYNVYELSKHRFIQGFQQ
jgi:hypothetical protein